jgi:hypothetical protein
MRIFSREIVPQRKTSKMIAKSSSMRMSVFVFPQKYLASLNDQHDGLLTPVRAKFEDARNNRPDDDRDEVGEIEHGCAP